MRNYSGFNQEKFEKIILEEIARPLIIDIVDNQKDIYRNTLDPFSALIDCMVRNCSPSNWKDQEVGRQSQKTLQNKVGNLHEYTIDCFDDWENLDTGKVIDIVSHKNKVIAEIKNKHNTTKGNHKKDIYDDLDSVLKKDYIGYTAYYVEILPKNREVYNKNFTPSDNTKNGLHRESRNDIRVIDGASFYELISGSANFIKDLYLQFLPQALENAIKNINTGRNANQQLSYPSNLTADKMILEFFNKAY